MMDLRITELAIEEVMSKLRIADYELAQVPYLADESSQFSKLCGQFKKDVSVLMENSRLRLQQAQSELEQDYTPDEQHELGQAAVDILLSGSRHGK